VAGVVFLIPNDLTPFAKIDEAKAQEMIEDAEALAALAAPCLNEPEFVGRPELVGAVKAILRRAILRWNDAGTGATVQIGAGPFNQTTAQGTNTPRTLFWPSEIEQLRELCAAFKGTVDDDAAFMVDMTGGVSGAGGLASRPDLWFQMVQPTPHGAP